MQKVYEKIIAWSSFKKFVVVFLVQMLLLFVIFFVAVPDFRLITAGYDPFIVQKNINVTEIYKQLSYYSYKTIMFADLMITLDFIYSLLHVFGTIILWAWLFKINPIPFYGMLVRNHLFGLCALGAVVALSEGLGFLFLIHTYPYEFFDMARHACFIKKAKVIMISWVFNSLTLMFIFGNIFSRIARSRQTYWY